MCNLHLSQVRHVYYHRITQLVTTVSEVWLRLNCVHELLITLFLSQEIPHLLCHYRLFFNTIELKRTSKQGKLLSTKNYSTILSDLNFLYTTVHICTVCIAMPFVPLSHLLALIDSYLSKLLSRVFPAYCIIYSRAGPKYIDQGSK